jgi:hypothetical protein
MKDLINEFYNSVSNTEGDKEICPQQHKKHGDDFNSCLNRLPKSFVRFYMAKGFHDDILEKLELIKRRTKAKTFLDVVMQLNSGKEIYEIRYFDVIKFETSIDEDEYCEIGDYLDGEILAVDDYYLSHEFGFYSYPSKILIHFKKLSFKKLPIKR